MSQETTTATMRAVTQEVYGRPDVIEHRTIDVPTPGEGQVLIRVHAASVNPYDWHMMTGTPLITRLQGGLRRPKTTTLGADVSGVVAAVGPDVTEFAVGDAVWGAGLGTFAEYAIASVNRVVPQPDGVPMTHTAAIPMAGVTAIQGLRDRGGMKPGDHVLIIGASGGVGTYAVQIAKAWGAEVTAVVSTRNIEMVRALGADHVIDYTTTDFSTVDASYDVIFDNIGEAPFRGIRAVMADDGTYVMVSGPKHKFVGPIPRMLRMMALSAVVSQKLVPFMAKFTKDDLAALNEMVTDGRIRTVIDREFPLGATHDALWHQGEGHAQGKTVIITPTGEKETT